MENRLHPTEEALRQREITFAALAKVAPVGIMRFDGDGRCNYVNDRWLQITGLTIDQAIGKGWRNAIHLDDRAAVMEHWQRMRNGAELFREEYRIRRPDGSLRWVMAEGAVLMSYSGERIGFIRAVTDITRHRQLENELLCAREELEERVMERTADLEAQIRERQKLEKQILETKDNEQRRFSQDLHDGLGQSLTGILFRLLALERDLEAQKSPHAGSASKIAGLVNQAINQAHDLARGVQPVPLRADGLMVALQELVEKVSGCYMVNCVFQCEEPVRVSDHSAATHIFRIAQEALTNALKHSGAHKVVVRLEHRAHGCALVVEDDGHGPSAHAAESTGRGLNIMRHRARLIDARLDFRPIAAGGTILECVFNQHTASSVSDEECEKIASAGGR
jgi:PAS domain S-box-containing protein